MRTTKMKKKAGFVVTSELILITTIVVIGLVIGLTTVRNAVNVELEDFAEAIGAVDQSFFVVGAVNDNASATIPTSTMADEADPTSAADDIFWVLTDAQGSEIGGGSN
ncbi:MAG: hypothetical protein ACI9TH_002733 [Kiritimatiellia bacterium]|jgi:hypothetical protein